MTQSYLGRRVVLTSRVPFDVGRRAAVAATAKRWSMSEYVCWCVERALAQESRRTRKAATTLSEVGVPAGNPEDPWPPQ